MNSFLFRYDTKDKVLDERERLEFYGYPADYLETYKAALEKVTLADVTAVAKKYIHPEKLAVLVVGNGPEIKPGLDALESGPGASSGHHDTDAGTTGGRGWRRGEVAAELKLTDGRIGKWRESARVKTDAKTIEELVAEDTKLRTEAAARLMAAGVTIYRPETCVIDAEVEVAADTMIEPFVQLLGRTRVGAKCLIRSFTVIENCTLGNNVLVRQSCVLTDSTVGDGAKIGPFAHLRPESEIGEDAHVGNFVETKKVKLGKGAKANHLTYLGDADVGEGSNIGAGVITCNYDGVNKHRTQIGKGAFVGSDSTLVAPVTVGEGAYIGAGSCITKDVPAGSLAVSRSPQVIKEGWAEAKTSVPKGKRMMRNWN